MNSIFILCYRDLNSLLTANMQSVQRRFGKFLPRTADEAQVGVLLKDFEDADKMLAKVLLEKEVLESTC